MKLKIETDHVCITKTNLLMLFVEMIAADLSIRNT
jgi:hypothetical protein